MAKTTNVHITLYPEDIQAVEDQQRAFGVGTTFSQAVRLIIRQWVQRKAHDNDATSTDRQTQPCE